MVEKRFLMVITITSAVPGIHKNLVEECAVIETYPGVQILACFFHFSQNVKKHVCEVDYLNMGR